MNKMFETLLTSEIARSIIGFVVGFGIWRHLQREKEIPCNHCEYLVKCGGDVWKYKCNPKGEKIEKFDRPPKYCKYFKERSNDKSD